MLDIIAATEEIIPGWNTYDFPRVPTWYNDRMIIIGDAVHATSPSSGQGASMAIEDAVVLAKCLRDIPDTAAAFAAFKKLRKERVERVVKHGKRSGDGKAQGAVGAMIRDLVLPTITGLATTRVIQRLVPALDRVILRDHHLAFLGGCKERPHG